LRAGVTGPAGNRRDAAVLGRPSTPRTVVLGVQLSAVPTTRYPLAADSSGDEFGTAS
jgi:hypothetical protein